MLVLAASGCCFIVIVTIEKEKECNEISLKEEEYFIIAWRDFFGLLCLGMTRCILLLLYFNNPSPIRCPAHVIDSTG